MFFKPKLTDINGKSLDKPGGIRVYQPLIDHLSDVSEYAMKFCAKFGAKNWGKVTGFFHDVGKASKPFQNRLEGSEEKVDHSSFGAQYLWNKLKNNVGKALGYIICAHHGGLPNALTGQSKKDEHSSLHERLHKDLPAIFPEALKEYDQIKIPSLKLPGEPFKRFLFIKMVLSSLVDADRLDSEEYGSPERSKLRGLGDLMPFLYGKMKSHIKNLEHKQGKTFLDKIRCDIQKRCWWMAFWFRGFFTLTVPTGGGKTLASMYFALRHAKLHGFDRIIYVIPYTSIIEQNAGIFRGILGANNIIEHHCNFDKKNVKGYEDLTHHFLSTENWDAPIIVTTNVQFFESLYGSGASRNRRIHNINNSVIVLDEGHLLPPRLLKPCIKVLKELVKSYRCSVLFCTATQPGLVKENNFNWGIDKTKEIVKDPQKLYRDLQRVECEYRPDIVKDSQLISLVNKIPIVLCVVNTKKHARLIYEDIKMKCKAYHLSTLMCAAHRRKVIAAIRNDLVSGIPCKLVSTQLIECGVNLDFPEAIRNSCNIDSLIQTGGRCNREGLLKDASGNPVKGRLIITNVKHDFIDDFFPRSKEIAHLYLMKKENVLDCDVAQRAFNDLYKIMDGKLDKKGILDLIHQSGMDIPFEEISNRFDVIESSAISVIIPYDIKAMDLIAELSLYPDDFRITRALQQYTVQIYENQLNKIMYAIRMIGPYHVLADATLYDPNVGLKIFSTKELNDYRI